MPNRPTNAAKWVVILIIVLGIGGMLLPVAYTLLRPGEHFLGINPTLIFAFGVLYLFVGALLVWVTGSLDKRRMRKAALTKHSSPEDFNSLLPAVKVRARGDDFTVIEGIGLKSQDVLYQAGIRTYAQLAQTSVKNLERIVTIENRIAVLDGLIETWPRQARYIVEGDTAGLKAYQASLTRAADEAE